MSSEAGTLNQLPIPETKTGSYIAGVADNFSYVEEPIVFDIDANREDLMIRVDVPPALIYRDKYKRVAFKHSINSRFDRPRFSLRWRWSLNSPLRKVKSSL